jgi:hypothetical protein
VGWRRRDEKEVEFLELGQIVNMADRLQMRIGSAEFML